MHHVPIKHIVIIAEKVKCVSEEHAEVLVIGPRVKRQAPRIVQRCHENIRLSITQSCYGYIIFLLKNGLKLSLSRLRLKVLPGQ